MEDASRYCYSVWLRHLSLLKSNGLNVYPKIVAELGPGDSIGTGVISLLTGVDKCYLFDVAKYINEDKNFNFYNELLDLLKERENIPDQKEFPLIKPELDNYDFPNDIYSSDYLDSILNETRLNQIKEALIDI